MAEKPRPARRRQSKEGAGREKPLRENPELFREIFGDAEFPRQAIRSLLTSLAAIEVEAYFIDPEKYADPKDRAAAGRDRDAAERYIFSGRNKAWPFSFDSVCKTIGIDPDRTRAKIRVMTPEEFKQVKRIKNSRRFEDD